MIKNQKGITLIELLATLTILTIISGLVYGVLIGTTKNYQKLSSKADLSREANLILATVKNVHEKTGKTAGNTNAEYEIDFLSGQYMIGEKNASSNPLHSKKFSVEVYKNHALVNGKTKISSLQPLTIKVIVKDSNGQSYEVDTIIKKH
ncbi:type II secretion system protein [Neobacillus notoginsengisoli]|uniref:Type II secretion system protein n=1 Tax=Neobacillus notoginsengisoli TaxID=1578198 RepID=A0A417YU25_9BACI|nr:prepilin-type N-terminal cleavage/methylation domain-containing protein [Neobacillus notoginsengisoli]RHW40648.1 type II secretion system protein [Neobacillus notoginsengisoli]